MEVGAEMEGLCIKILGAFWALGHVGLRAVKCETKSPTLYRVNMQLSELL